MKDTTTTIDEGQTLDEILNKFADSGCMLHSLQEKAVKKAKQALLQWHKSKARSYVPEKPSNELTHMSIAEQHGYEQAIDQTLKAIEESK